MSLENIKDATPVELKAIQDKELEVLNLFKEIVQKENLPFYLAGGSLIGAVRDGGFIPWDDDIDVMMWRKDFETLYSKRETAFGETPLVLARSTEKINQHLTGMTLRDSSTTFINKHSLHEKGLIQSIGFDILPIDYRASGKLNIIKQQLWAIIFSLYNADRLPDHQGMAVRFLSWLPLKIFTKHQKYKIWKHAERRMVALGDKNSGFAIELGVGLTRIFKPIKLELLEPVQFVPFEEGSMPIPTGYD